MKLYCSYMEFKDGREPWRDIWIDREKALSYCSNFDKYKDLVRGELYVMEPGDVHYQITEYLIEYDVEGKNYYNCKSCEWWRTKGNWEEEEEK